MYMTLSSRFAPEEATRRRKLSVINYLTFSTLYVPKLTEVHSFTIFR